jgi:hypothetical protein
VATDKEIYELILRIEGEQEAKKLAAALALAEQKYQALYDTLGKGAAQTKAAAASLAGLQSQMAKVQGSMKGAGQAMMQIGYAADDLQYGFKGVANNIQPILGSIPSLAKLAGPISIAAIAAYQLWEHWGQVKELFGLGVPQPALTGTELLAANLKKASDAMEELASKTRLEWYELERLNKLREQVKDLKAADAAQKNVDSATSAQSEAEKARGSGFGKAVAESGGKDAFDQFKGVLDDSKNAQGLVLNEATGRMGKPSDVARDMFDAALKGDKIARDAIRKALPKGSRFAENIAEMSPEIAKLYEDMDEENGRDSDKQKKDRWEEQFYKDLDEENGRDIDRQKKEAAEEARRVTAGTGFGARVDTAMLRSSLNSGGAPGVATAQVAEQIERELLARGMGKLDAKNAAKGIAEEHAARLGDDINERVLKGPAPLDKVQHIGASDFARSVESSGAKDLSKIAGGIEDMKNQFATIIKNQEKGQRLGP